jgi:hypothetical protein
LKYPCIHWRDGGICNIGMYDGRPSLGVCDRACPRREGDPEEIRLAGIALDNLVMRRRNRARAEKEKKPCGCNAPKIISWLKVRWIGIPWPKRWVWNPYQMEFEYRDSPGCGCILKLKRLTEYGKLWWKV